MLWEHWQRKGKGRSLAHTAPKQKKRCLERATSEGRAAVDKIVAKESPERERVMQEMKSCKLRLRMLSWIFANLSQ